ncbi:hypothetical protein ABPG75_002273 [Micractinium tetrahymenae]
MRAAALVCLLLLAAAAPAAVGQSNPVQGRATCPAASLVTGNLGCDNKNIFLGSGSRFVLEKVTPGINLYRIRMQARLPALQAGRTTGGCTRTYLGAARATGSPGKDCGDPKISVYSASDPSALTVWRIDVLPPPPARRPPPKRWFDDIDLDLELFAPNGCHMYYDYRGPVDCDCRSLGTFLEFDCRTLKECPLGMQEYIPIKSPLFGNYTVRVHDFDKVNQGAAFALFIYRDGVEERIDANVDYSCPGYPESKCITVLYP